MRPLLVIVVLALAVGVGCKDKEQEAKPEDTSRPYEPPPFEPEIDPPDATPERREVDEQSLTECIRTCVSAGKDEEDPPPNLRERCVNACTERCIIICVERAEVRKELSESTRDDCAASCKL